MSMQTTMDRIGLQARRSRMTYEAGATSLRKHLTTLDTLHRLYWSLRAIRNLNLEGTLSE